MAYRLDTKARIRLFILLVNEFKAAVLFFILFILGGGYLLNTHYGAKLPYTDAVFAAFAASFFEIIVSPPFPWYIQLFFYVAPVAGLYVIADTLSMAVIMFFGKRRKLQRWWEMVSSTYQDHVVVCGVGKVGYRIINELRAMGQPVVGINNDGEKPFVQELLEDSVPIIIGNIRLNSVLEKANIKGAKAVICVTNDDLTNMDCAFSARELKPDIRVVMRLFDDTIAEKMTQQFDFPALSTSRASAPAFVSEALGLDISPPNLTVYGHTAQVHTLNVTEEMSGKTIGDLEESKHIKILGCKTSDGEEIFPSPKHKVQSGQQLIAVGLHRG